MMLYINLHYCENSTGVSVNVRSSQNNLHYVLYHHDASMQYLPSAALRYHDTLLKGRECSPGGSTLTTKATMY